MLGKTASLLLGVQTLKQGQNLKAFEVPYND